MASASSHFGLLHRLLGVLLDLVEDGVGRLGRREQAMPAVHHDVDALFLERRHVGQRLDALLAGHGQRPEVAGLDLGTAGGSEEKFMVIWPLITSASAGPVPL